MNATDIAKALKQLDWADVPMGNKAVIQQAIAALEHTSQQFPGDAIGYVAPEVAAGSKEWERATLFDTPEEENTAPVYAAPISAAAAIGIVRAETRAKGLNAALHACLDKVSEYEAREWVGDASGARACVEAIRVLLDAAPVERVEAATVVDLAQRIIEYGDAREARDTATTQATFYAILAALPATATEDSAAVQPDLRTRGAHELAGSTASATPSSDAQTNPSAVAHRITLWEAFEMGFAFRSALLGHVLDGRDVGRLTTCDFWPEPMLGMHEGADLHVGLSVGQAVARLKSEVRRRLDSLDVASQGRGAAPGYADMLRGWTIEPYVNGWVVVEPGGRSHVVFDVPESDETEQVLARVCAVLANGTGQETNTEGN